MCLDESGEPLPDNEAPRHRATREELFNVQFSAKTQDGAQRRFEATGAPLRDDEKGRQGGVIVIRDITEGE